MKQLICQMLIAVAACQDDQTKFRINATKNSFVLKGHNSIVTYPIASDQCLDCSS